MSDLGVEFVSEPVLLGEFWQVYANDIDGNVFALRQWADPNSPWSVPNLELQQIFITKLMNFIPILGNLNGP